MSVDRALNEVLDLAAALLLDQAPDRDRAAQLRQRIAELLPTVRKGRSPLVGQMVEALEVICEAELRGRPASGALAYVSRAVVEARAAMAELCALRAARWVDQAYAEHGI